MPRPEVESIGTKYRRIPILTIGKDIYNDTRLILSKLETLFPSDSGNSGYRSIAGQKPEEKALEGLLERWAVEGGGLFQRAVQCMPSELPLLKDEAFLKDREDYSGRIWSKASIDAQRPEGLVEMTNNFTFLETTLLQDGRKFLLGTEGPSLADIEAVWVLHWIRQIPGALPSNLLSSTQFPKVHAWIDSFIAAVQSATESAPSTNTLSSTEALKQISNSSFAENEAGVSEDDPSGLKKGDQVEVWPVDTGSSRRDMGRLVGLDGREIVVEGRTEGGVGVRIHAPRHGFRVRGVGKI